MIEVHGQSTSGNCWKVAQILRSTGQPFRWVEVDAMAGGTRTAVFLALSPFGKVPVAVLDDGTVLRESNAILLHFGEGTPWLPAPGLARTRVVEWLFFEQYSHEPYVAVARSLMLWRGERDPSRLQPLWDRGNAALAAMERRLTAHDWLTDAGPTVADLALFAYTHRAGEGGFTLADHPGVEAWVRRVTALPGVATMPPVQSPP